MSDFPRGSEWNKWDLHVHTPASYDWDSNCKMNNGDIVKSAINNGLSAIAITDHHTVASIDEISRIGSEEGLLVVPGVEIRTDKGNKKIHIIGLFNPSTNAKTIYDKILCPLGFSDDDIRQKGNSQVYCQFEQACQTIHELGGLVFLHAGNKSNGIEQLDSDIKALLKTDLALMVDLFEVNSERQSSAYWKIVFPDIENHFPCLITSDSYERSIYKNGHSVEGLGKLFSWLKADLTFEGLKQIIYEPEPGERVWLGPTPPDGKEDYKVIEKIIFKDANDFPKEIIFNRNLCSIIGSRSSGKSALLAYLADGVNEEKTRAQIPGPGDGFSWKNVNFQYSVIWANGKSNGDSPGNIVYIPQNYLFELSKNSEEIKEKIKPVLFKVVPTFKENYSQTESKVSSINRQISNSIDDWFLASDHLKILANELKELGKKESVKSEIRQITTKINKLKEKDQLSEDDVRKYGEVKAEISTTTIQFKQAQSDLSKLEYVSEEKSFFTAVELITFPDLNNLPDGLKISISKFLDDVKLQTLTGVNAQVLTYTEVLKTTAKELGKKIKKIKVDNSQLIEKYQQNIELRELIEKRNGQEEIIRAIDQKDIDKKAVYSKLKSIENAIKANVDSRIKSITVLADNLKNMDQDATENINFGIEYGVDNTAKDEVCRKINLKENTDFVKTSTFDLEKVREKPGFFLLAVYDGAQKINAGHLKKSVAKEVLGLTEKLLFTAVMEGDKIGGFSESTMTPGKRALFALRLILTESDGSWPLLIDQPEDDLDSRSIYDEIVPFVREKKKKRQIILVSHNANMVIGSDSEQIIVANRNGIDRKNTDGKQFNYAAGSIENTEIKDCSCKDTLGSQGIKEHTCDILDGGKPAFEKRINKYNIELKRR